MKEILLLSGKTRNLVISKKKKKNVGLQVEGKGSLIFPIPLLKQWKNTSLKIPLLRTKGKKKRSKFITGLFITMSLSQLSIQL